MLRDFLIFSLCFLAIRASTVGEFSVLNSPKSLVFKGNDALPSQYVGDVLYVALGNPVAGDAEWSGLIVGDPFNLAKAVVAVFVDGIPHISVNSNSKSYPLLGGSSYESLNAVSAQAEANNEPVCDINFNNYEEAVIAHRTCFGDIPIPEIGETKSLNTALHTADKQFLQSVSFLNAAADNLGNMKEESNFLIIRLSLESIAKAHGEKSEAFVEASKILSAAIANLNAAAQKSSNNEALVVLITNKLEGGRAKREAVQPDAKVNQYNLAEYYSDDYPVIFNIILWFMVVFGFSLLAICYAIGSMDPGRDSIIYRMTSTRMKKDN